MSKTSPVLTNEVPSEVPPVQPAGEEGSQTDAPAVEGEERWFDRRAWIDGDGLPQDYVIGKPSTMPRPVLKDFATDGDYPLRWIAAKNPRTPVKCLAELARDPDASRQNDWDYDVDILESVAKNPSCPPTVLRRMAAELGPDIRTAVASNPRTPSDVLAELARDATWSGRLQGYPMREAAENPSTPAEVLRWISQVTDEDIGFHPGNRQHRLSALAHNPSTPPDVRAWLEGVKGGLWS